MPDPSLLQRLKERKLVQWAVAYLAGAWLLYEVTSTVGGDWNLPTVFFRGLSVVLVIGFFITFILAWYHGEKGRQRVSGPELLILAMLFALGALGLSFLRGKPPPDSAGRAGAPEDLAAELEALPGIAVLPFVNRSALPDDQYLVDGMHDELLTRLQRTSGLRVIARTSVEEYRDSNRPVREIGQELGVGFVLEGGVQRAGDRVRINLQLIDTQDEGHLWGETFDRVITPENLFDIQTEVVHSIAGELSLALRQEDLDRAARRTASDPAAYDLFIRGMDAWRQSGGGAMEGAAARREAADLFREAIERDPDFVVAQAKASQVNAMIWGYSGERTPERAEAARTAAERALALDPDSEDAQLAMGVYLYRVERDYEGAMRWLGRASGSLRGDLDYLRYRGYAERRLGRWEAAVGSLRAALALSPQSSGLWNELGITYQSMRRYDDAESALRKAVTLSPDAPRPTHDLAIEMLEHRGDAEPLRDFSRRFPRFYESWEAVMIEGDFQNALVILDGIEAPHSNPNFWRPRALYEAWTHEALGNRELGRDAYVRAAAELEAQIQDAPQDERYHAALGLAYAGLGRRDEAVAEATRATELLPVEKDAHSGPHQLISLAAVYARFEELDQALAILERLLTIPSLYSAARFRQHVLLRPLHENPAFQALLEKYADGER